MGFTRSFLDSDSRVLCLPGDLSFGDSCPSSTACSFESQEAKTKAKEVGSCILGGSLQYPGWLAVSMDMIIQPSTVLRWHRQGFKRFWKRKSRDRAGRPKIDAEIRRLIRRLSKEIPTWGIPKITSELAFLGYDVTESTIAKYIVHYPKPPTQTWRTFLRNHAADIIGGEFSTAYRSAAGKSR